jgi:hypothetical protein
MDFKRVLDIVLKAFEEEQVRYALIGGLALGAWGVPAPPWTSTFCSIMMTS